MDIQWIHVHRIGMDIPMDIHVKSVDMDDF